MRNGRHVLNVGNLVATAVERANRGLTARTGTLDSDFQVLQPVILGGVTRVFGSHLGRERRAFAGTTEAGTTGGRQDNALP